MSELYNKHKKYHARAWDAIDEGDYHIALGCVSVMRDLLIQARAEGLDAATLHEMATDHINTLAMAHDIARHDENRREWGY